MAITITCDTAAEFAEMVAMMNSGGNVVGASKIDHMAAALDSISKQLGSLISDGSAINSGESKPLRIGGGPKKMSVISTPAPAQGAADNRADPEVVDTKEPSRRGRRAKAHDDRGAETASEVKLDMVGDSRGEPVDAVQDTGAEPDQEPTGGDNPGEGAADTSEIPRYTYAQVYDALRAWSTKVDRVAFAALMTECAVSTVPELEGRPELFDKIMKHISA